MQGAFVPLAHLLDVVHIELQELEAELNPCNLGKRFRNLMMDHSWVRSTISLTAGTIYVNHDLVLEVAPDYGYTTALMVCLKVLSWRFNDLVADALIEGS